MKVCPGKTMPAVMCEHASFVSLQNIFFPAMTVHFFSYHIDHISCQKTGWSEVVSEEELNNSVAPSQRSNRVDAV